MIHKVAWQCRARVVLSAGALFGCSVYQSELLTSAAASGGGAAQPLPNTAGSAGSGASSGQVQSNTTGGTNGGAGSGGSAGSVGGSNDAGSAGSSGSGTTGDPSTASGSAGVGGAGGNPAAPAPVLELVDDMEDGDAFVKVAAGRNGHWDVSHDASAAATQVPAPASFMMTPLADAALPNSHFAAYTQGAGFKDWGAFLNVSMRTWPVYDDTPAYDASAYAGISFVAKVGAGSDTTLRVRFVGGQTDPRGKQCTVGGGVETACFDHFYTTVTLTHDFARYDLYFDDFVQAGVGKAYPALDLSKMYGLELFFPGRNTPNGNAFELWVDELSFIPAPPAK